MEHFLKISLTHIFYARINYFQVACAFLPHNSENTSESCSVISTSLQPYGLYSPWNSPAQNTGVGSLSLLQGIFPTQGLNPDLLNSLPAEPQGKPKNTGVGSLSFSKGSSQTRNWSRVSYIAGGLFIYWTTSEALQGGSKCPVLFYVADLLFKWLPDSWQNS